MACCDSCAHGGACETACPGVDPTIPYDAVPFDRPNNAAQLMSWNRYPRPYVYADPLTRGGATQLRYAQTARGSSAMPGMPDTGSGGAWRRQLGELGETPSSMDFVCPEGQEFNISTLSCQPIGGGGTDTGGGEPPVELPKGLVTEEQCAAREEIAFSKGIDEAKSDSRSDLIYTAAISSLVAGVVGWGIGKVLR